MVCKQCIAIKKNGSRCKNKAACVQRPKCVEHCWLHCPYDKPPVAKKIPKVKKAPVAEALQAKKLPKAPKAKKAPVAEALQAKKLPKAPKAKKALVAEALQAKKLPKAPKAKKALVAETLKAKKLPKAPKAKKAPVAKALKAKKLPKAPKAPKTKKIKKVLGAKKSEAQNYEIQMAIIQKKYDDEIKAIDSKYATKKSTGVNLIPAAKKSTEVNLIPAVPKPAPKPASKAKHKGGLFRLPDYDSGDKHDLSSLNMLDWMFIDTDKNNIISLEEYKDAIPKYFSLIPNDQRKLIEANFDRYDTNKDKQLQKHETEQLTRDFREENYQYIGYQKHSKSSNMMETEFPCYGKPGTLKGMSIPSSEYTVLFKLMRYLVEFEGVRTYINFNVADKKEEEVFNAVCVDKSKCKFYHLEVHDYEPPTKAVLSKFLDLVHKSKHKVNIAMHCTAGMGRTGAMALAYLMMSQAWKGLDMNKKVLQVIKTMDKFPVQPIQEKIEAIKKTYLFKLLYDKYSPDAADEVFIDAAKGTESNIILLRKRLAVIMEVIESRMKEKKKKH